MLPLVAKTGGGRAFAVALALGGMMTSAAMIAWALRGHMALRPAAVHAPWIPSCSERLSSARAALVDLAPEFARARVDEAWAIGEARAELTLPPQYAARVVYRPGEEVPPVFDWEEAATPVSGSFALHRHVGDFDLLVVADDSDERGLRFAAILQPLLDKCVMEAR